MLKNHVLQEDLERLEKCLSLEELHGKSIFITGATGLIGAQIVKLLSLHNELSSEQINIIAFVRSIEKAKQILGDLIEKSKIQLCVGDINREIKWHTNVDYIIHGASVTSSKSFVTSPVETIKTAIEGTDHILSFAREKSVSGFIYLSSLEVYGVPVKDGFIKEEDYGYIDPLSVRSSYSEGKRMVECLCVSYAKQYGIPIKIARLSQTFGAGVEYNDGRVFAEFARCAIEGRNIILHTKGNTIRSYCYTTDAIAAIFYILLKGQVGEAYNVTNMSTVVSIKEMAQLVCDIAAEKNIEVKYDIPEDIELYGFNPEMVIKLDSTKLLQLGWAPKLELREMFIRLICSMENSRG